MSKHNVVNKHNIVNKHNVTKYLHSMSIAGVLSKVRHSGLVTTTMGGTRVTSVGKSDWNIGVLPC